MALWLTGGMVPVDERLGVVLGRMLRHPIRTIVPRWSWKAAGLSALLRAGTFFFTNLKAGEHKAIHAMLVEAVFAVIAAGLLGAVSQTLRCAKPEWATAIFVWLAMPMAMVLAQFGVHRLAGTKYLGTGLIFSFVFAGVASSFSWYAMRQGALLGGDEETALAADVKALPRIVLGYVLVVPRALLRGVRSSEERSKE